MTAKKNSQANAEKAKVCRTIAARYGMAAKQIHAVVTALWESVLKPVATEEEKRERLSLFRIVAGVEDAVIRCNREQVAFLKRAATLEGNNSNTPRKMARRLAAHWDPDFVEDGGVVEWNERRGSEE